MSIDAVGALFAGGSAGAIALVLWQIEKHSPKPPDGPIERALDHATSGFLKAVYAALALAFVVTVGVALWRLATWAWG